MSRIHRVALLLLHLLPTLEAHSQIDSVVERELRDAHRIRLELTNLTRLDGRFQTLAPSYLVVLSIARPTFDQSSFEERQVSLDSLSRVWILDGTQSRNGAIVGGIVFGGMGLVLGAGFAEYSDSEERCAVVVCAAAGALSGGLLGTLTGGVLGALLPRWRLVWPL